MNWWDMWAQALAEAWTFVFTNKNDAPDPFIQQPFIQVIPRSMVPEPEQTPENIPPENVLTTTNLARTALYAAAKSLLGKVLAADNAADGFGMYGCAEAVNRVAVTALGHAIGGGASTELMYKELCNALRFVPVQDPLPGDIVICPTGSSTLGPGIHGHVGIVGYNWYMSNDSETATWEANYTRVAWEQSFAARGFKTHYFRYL